MNLFVVLVKKSIRYCYTVVQILPKKYIICTTWFIYIQLIVEFKFGYYFSEPTHKLFLVQRCVPCVVRVCTIQSTIFDLISAFGILCQGHPTPLSSRKHPIKKTLTSKKQELYEGKIALEGASQNQQRRQFKKQGNNQTLIFIYLFYKLYIIITQFSFFRRLNILIIIIFIWNTNIILLLWNYLVVMIEILGIYIHNW